MQKICFASWESHVTSLARYARPRHQLVAFGSRRTSGTFCSTHAALAGCSGIRSFTLPRQYNRRLVSGVHVQLRGISWLGRLFRGSQTSEQFSAVPDGQDDAARSAILEKVMKGRQPSDLMLRCVYMLLPQSLRADATSRHYTQRRRWVCITFSCAEV